MIRPNTFFNSTLMPVSAAVLLSGCTLLGAADKVTYAPEAQPATQQSAEQTQNPNPLLLRAGFDAADTAAPQKQYGAKSLNRSASGPRPLVPCFGDSPSARNCRADNARDTYKMQPTDYLMP